MSLKLDQGGPKPSSLQNQQQWEIEPVDGHDSDQTFMDSPQPTLHLAPFKRTSLPFKMLFQAREPELFYEASMREQSGKIWT